MTQTLPELLPAEDLTGFRAQVRRWHRKHGRDLPWQGESDAYRVWIREIMLQQTTVAAVMPYLDRFLERFPTVADVAAANEADVLKLWEGLGYYSRARNIHKAACDVMARFDGDMPESVEDLQSLPGIGRYTASAIASFASDIVAGIVEANTLRLYARLLAFAENPRSTTGQRLLWAFAEQIVPRRSPGVFNQALMDLGATVCTPTDPDCERCPVIGHCRAFAGGLQQEIPNLPKRVSITSVTEVSLVIRRRNQIALRQRGDDERWAGLWDFVRFEADETLGATLPVTPKSAGKGKAVSPSLFGLSNELTGELSSQAEQRTGLQIDNWKQLTEITHSVTRYRIRLVCFVGEVSGGRMQRSDGYQWVPIIELANVPLSKTAREMANLLQTGSS